MPHLQCPDLSESTAADYLDRLISLPLASLQKEPSSISSEASTVEAELTNLCYREYSTFISVYKSSTAIQTAFTDFDSSLDQLLDAVPDLEQACRQFSKQTSGLSSARTRAVLVKDHQEKLSNVLELPHLLETCIRNGYYQEAVELIDHSKRMSSKYPDAGIVKDVAKEVESVSQLMISQLLALLREPVKLPTLVKSIGFLRRIAVFDESTLSYVFINSRLANFRDQLVQLERQRSEPVMYVRKYIDAFRENVYDIVSQYSAIFEDPQLIDAFASHCVEDLLHLLSTYIPRLSGDSAAFSSILVQLGYCAQSFARVGLDFSALLPRSFVNTVISTFSHSVQLAHEQLVATLTSASQASGSPIDSLIRNGQRPQAGNVLPTDDLSQPPILDDSPPIALFVNAHLSALNSLRLLAPLEQHTVLANLQAASLAESTAAMLDFLKQSLDQPVVSASRPKHTRTPSSPRNHLLRRNTETQLSPAVRAARRYENQANSLYIARTWSATVRYLTSALHAQVYHSQDQVNLSRLEPHIGQLEAWITEHDQAPTNPPLQVLPDGEEKAEPVVEIEVSPEPANASPSVLVQDTSLKKSPTLPIASAADKSEADQPRTSSPKTPVDEDLPQVSGDAIGTDGGILHESVAPSGGIGDIDGVEHPPVETKKTAPLEDVLDMPIDPHTLAEPPMADDPSPPVEIESITGPEAESEPAHMLSAMPSLSPAELAETSESAPMRVASGSSVNSADETAKEPRTPAANGNPLATSEVVVEAEVSPSNPVPIVEDSQNDDDQPTEATFPGESEPPVSSASSVNGASTPTAIEPEQEVIGGAGEGTRQEDSKSDHGDTAAPSVEATAPTTGSSKAKKKKKKKKT